MSLLLLAHTHTHKKAVAQLKTVISKQSLLNKKLENAFPALKPKAFKERESTGETRRVRCNKYEEKRGQREGERARVKKSSKIYTG